jgi:DNA-binding PadR family transcriptional regulator
LDQRAGSLSFQDVDGNLVRGHIDGLVLAALERGPAHGYQVAIELRQLSDGAFDLAEGTLYPALHRLEHGGYVTSESTSVGGRRRRVYSLTDGGEAALAGKRDEWRDFAKAVEQVLLADADPSLAASN